MKSFMVVAYYTEGTLYEEDAKRLRASCDKFRVPYHIKAVPNLGTWDKNTSYKPDFVRDMLELFSNTNIVYVDADAEFKKFPTLFLTIEDQMKTDVAVYVFDRSVYKRSPGGFEVLSGTIFFKNTSEVMGIVEKWRQRTQSNIKEWDQKSLEIVLDGHHDLLPGEYCKIFDRMDFVTDPVIVHYQSSRKVRKHRGCLVKKN
jgi:hypothetical protein